MPAVSCSRTAYTLKPVRRPAIHSGRLRRFVTSSISPRCALVLVLAAAPLAAAGCRTAQGSGLRGDGLPGAAPVLAAPPVRAESVLDNGVRVVVEENHLAP